MVATASTGILPGRRFRRQHHRVGALEDRGGDVGDLGARRHRRGDHRFQHLRRDHHRLAGARGAARVICFWMPGTFSSGISTPRSPRATISASARSMISSSRVHRLRLLDLGHHGGAAARDLLGLGDVLRPLDERQRRPSRCRRRARRRDRSGPSSVSAENGMIGVGQADALAVGELAADLDARDDASAGSASVARQPHLAVVEQQRVAGLDARRRSPDAAGARAWRRRASDRRRA